MPMIRTIAMALSAAGLLAATPAAAKDLAFTAALSGDKAPTITGSKATGVAKLVVHTDTQTVDLALDVAGVTPDELWDKLKARPIGPIHLHLYGSRDRSGAGGVSLVMPVPYGATYAATPTGFRVRMTAYPFATGAALVNTSQTFDQFVGDLQTGRVVLNVHTNRFSDGEISGDVAPAA
jgi:hypothetical protein